MRNCFSIKRVDHFVLGLIGIVSFAMASFGANSTCFLVANQPKLPESVKQLRKF